MRIGRDHIASTIYTIVFAYAGTALSVLLLLSLYDRPVLDLLTDEAIAEECCAPWPRRSGWCWPCPPRPRSRRARWRRRCRADRSPSTPPRSGVDQLRRAAPALTGHVLLQVPATGLGQQRGADEAERGDGDVVAGHQPQRAVAPGDQPGRDQRREAGRDDAGDLVERAQRRVAVAGVEQLAPERRERAVDDAVDDAQAADERDGDAEGGAALDQPGRGEREQQRERGADVVDGLAAEPVAEAPGRPSPAPRRRPRRP